MKFYTCTRPVQPHHMVTNTLSDYGGFHGVVYNDGCELECGWTAKDVGL